MQTIMDQEQVFYVPGQPWVIDFVEQQPDGSCVAAATGQTQEQIAAVSPGVILCTYAEARKQIESRAKSEPKPISEEDFTFALNCLPPMDWRHDANGESFKMSEFITGNVTSIYARMGNTYWMLDDVCTLSHREILERIALVSRKAG